MLMVFLHYNHMLQIYIDFYILNSNSFYKQLVSVSI